MFFNKNKSGLNKEKLYLKVRLAVGRVPYKKYGSVLTWLVWLSWLEHCAETQRLWVHSPVWSPMEGNQQMLLSDKNVSLSLVLSLFLSLKTMKKMSSNKDKTYIYESISKIRPESLLLQRQGGVESALTEIFMEM